MTRINKKLSFFRRYYNLIFGILWLLMGLFYMLSRYFSEDNSVWNNFTLVIFYIVLGLLYFFRSYWESRQNGEFIEWNDEFLIYKPIGQKIQVYKINELSGLTVSNNDLIIKAPGAQGTMVELKGYCEEDIAKLRSQFS